MKHVDLAPLAKATNPLWQAIVDSWTQHHLLTIVCGFFALMMTLSFYRFLKSISPALVAFILLLIFGIIVMHWTVTRTEPAIFKPAIDFLAPFFPAPPDFPTSPHSAQPKPPPPKPKQ